MKIAIVESISHHIECIAFILEIFKDKNIDIYLTNKSDKYNWIDFYKTIYKFNVLINKFKEFDVEKYDLVFKLTINDNCIEGKKIIPIIHVYDIKYINKYNKIISLTPYISHKKIKYLFPVFKPEITYSNNKIITLIGYYKNSSIDTDTDLFISNNKKYTFNFVVWGSSDYNNLKKHKNIKVFKNIKTKELVKLINSSKYILSKKYINYDRFSGQLSLAMSFEKPMIIDKKTAETYNLPGIIFKKRYNEVGYLDNISDDKYKNIIDEIKKFNEKTINNNIKILSNI